MRGPIRMAVLAGLVLCAMVGLTFGQASGAVVRIKGSATGLLAIYGSPAVSTAQPIGGGLARNFGFGEDMLFKATNSVPAEGMEITLGGVVNRSEEAYFGGTLQSNKTGANNPVGFTIEFSDLARATIGGQLTALYSDTSDRPWTGTICSPEAGTTCKVDPLVTAAPGEVKFENVALNYGPGTVIQGTMWGKWVNGSATTPPCFSFNLPPSSAAADETLAVTQSTIFPLGTKITAIRGKACLVGANNDYYEGHKEVIEVADTE
jgi:hypothetical protein